MIQKKIRSLIFAGLGLVLCVLLCGGIGMTAQAESYGNLTYVENESGITITGYTGNKTKLVIPGKIKGKKVTSIGDSAFSGCSGLSSITIPKSVTSIGVGAFFDCSGLTSIIVDKGNKYYDSRNNCNAIIETKSNTLVSGCKKTVIPSNVTSIRDGAFSGCSDLKSITIPKSVTIIYSYAFSGCRGLTSITISNGVTSIYNGAFEGCSGLTRITIPDSVTYIGGYDDEGVFRNAFAGCSSLTSIKVSKRNKYYDSRNNCNAIIETKSNRLVSGCKKTVIPKSVTSIGGCAFSGCSGLKSITIPKSVTSIGWGAFKGVKKNITITVKGTKKAKTALKKQLKKKSIGYVKTWKIK